MRMPPLPEAPREASRPPFPFIAVVAPMVGAVVIGLVLASPFMLLFAALGPIVAVGGVLDARRNARRHRRREVERFERECTLFDQAVDRAHAAERTAVAERHPRTPRSLAPSEADEYLRIGTAPALSSVLIDSVRPVGDSDDDRRLEGMLSRARQNPDLPVLIRRGPMVLRGSGLAAEVLARRLNREPGVTLHRVDGSGHTAGDVSAPADAIELSVRSATEFELREPGCTPRRVRAEFATERQLDAAAANGPSEPVPTAVSWSALQGRTDRSTSVSEVAIGIGETGVVGIDLVRSGPHALVGGTTGSGKSELLRALALGWASANPPGAAQLLFVDFKGGATFARLTELPHSIGLVTDLDPVVAQRAVRALRAELRHRERALTDAGVRDLRDDPSLVPRLLVLVDEFATLVATFPELHEVFADVAARGRSLGVHLVLCTQHPASIVRDAIAANCPVRLSFRVTEASSGGIIGARARELVAAPPGRAVIVDDAGARLLQVAVVDDDDITRVLQQWQGHPRAASTWCPPLPDYLERHEIPPRDNDSIVGDEVSAIEQVAFGVLDDPDERRRVPATWRPPRDGSLMVLGSSKSGRSTLLATLAASLPEPARPMVLPAQVPEAWQVLERVAVDTPAMTLLICDGLDSLLASAGDRAAEVLARWDAAVRSLRAHGGAAVASVGGAAAGGSLMVGRFESRVVLRCADADEHAMAGGPRGLFDQRAPAGRGWWRGLQVQVAVGVEPVPRSEPAPAVHWHPSPDGDAIVVTSRVADVVDRIMQTGLPHRPVRVVNHVDAASLDPAQSVALEPRLLIGTPAEWQASWPLLAACRNRMPIVLIEVDQADVRTLLGHREVLPPIDSRRSECWLAEPDRAIVRASWSSVAGAVAESPRRD